MSKSCSYRGSLTAGDCIFTRGVQPRVPVKRIDPPSQTSHPMVFMDACSRSSIIVVRPVGSFSGSGAVCWEG